MLCDIVSVSLLEDYRLRIRFEDGIEGEVNVMEMVNFEGIFEPLKNREFFAQVKVNPDLGTIVWPNDADLDPDVLYAKITGKPIPAFVEIEQHSS